MTDHITHFYKQLQLSKKRKLVKLKIESLRKAMNIISLNYLGLFLITDQYILVNRI